MVITSWHNFGEMRTPLDAKWRRSWRPSKISRVTDLGSLKRTFEGDDNFTVENSVSQGEMATLKAGGHKALKMLLDYSKKSSDYYPWNSNNSLDCNCCAERFSGQSNSRWIALQDTHMSA
jgi:hypothetical protein